MTTAFVYRRTLVLLWAVIAVSVALGAYAATAAAAPVWQLGITAPDRVEPGATFEYAVVAQNVGDTATDGTGVLDISLPPGITGVSTEGFAWTCNDPVDQSVLHCEMSLPFPVGPGEFYLSGLTGNSAFGELAIRASVSPEASGSLTTQYSVSGGGTSGPSTVGKPLIVSTAPRFGLSALDGEVADAQGNAFTQAGGHPADASVTFSTNRVVRMMSNGSLGIFPDGGSLKDVEVALPPGFIGNPTAVPACSKSLIVPTEQEASGTNVDPNSFCPLNSIVGTARVVFRSAEAVRRKLVPIFNIEPPPGIPAQFAFTFGPFVTYFEAELRNNGSYTLGVVSRNAFQALPILAVETTLWGVPADPSHDDFRCLSYGGPGDNLGEFGPYPDCSTNPGANPLLSPSSANLPPKAFLTNPTACTPEGVGVDTTMTVTGWSDSRPTDTESFESHVPPGYPLPVDRWGSPQGPTGCENVPFTPEVSAQPLSRQADSPTGLDFSVLVPADGLESSTGIAQSHLKKAVVTLPEGVAVNPSSANGLGACSESQLGISHAGVADLEPIACPESSRIGTVSVDTPLLEESLDGSVYLAEQGNRPGRGSNPFDSMLALYLVVESEKRGLRIKLPGRVDADPQTGQLRATFDNNPQLPFSSLSVRMKSGPRAPLALPAQCGTYEIVSELYPWARPDEPVTVRSPFTVDQGCGPRGFAPDWSAGVVSPVAGSFSPLVASFSRSDREQRFNDLAVDMPKGVLAKLAGVPLCSEAQASVGDCPAGSRVGSATAGAGAGSNPFYLTDQPVYLTGPYKGAPYGLAVAVRVLAGPFDLGTVVVRQAIHVDRSTAQVRVASDPLPRILEGIPLNIRDVRVDIDRPGFTINPTSCLEKEVAATLTSTEGAAHRAASRFQVGDCAALRFRPKLALRLTGRNQVRTGRHPGVRALVRQSGFGEAGIAKAKVTLPKSLALDPDNAQALCEFADGTKPDLENHCPKGSIVGRARAVTPLLDEPLAGNVYFVKNVRRSSSGNLIRTLPMVVVALRGRIAINLKGESSTTRGGSLVNTFANVPDAPITRFNLNINGGSNGILTVTRTRRSRINLCSAPKSHIASVQMDGQNAKRADYRTRVKTPCARKQRRRG